MRQISQDLNESSQQVNFAGVVELDVCVVLEVFNPFVQFTDR